MHLHQIGVVFSEPHFIKSLLPWHNARLSCLLKECRHLLPPAYRQSALTDPPTSIASQPSLIDRNITTSATVLPACFSIHVMAVSFDDLWKIRAPCQKRCEFNLEIFDEMVDLARSRTGEVVEPQPLWEYPCYALHDPVEVTKLYLREDLGDVERHFKGMVELDLDKLSSSEASRPDRFKRHLLAARKVKRDEPELYFNGVAVWADWHFADKTLSSGPLIQDKLVGKKVLWNKTCQQGVHLLRRGVNLLAASPAIAARTSKVFHYSVDVTQGQLVFSFHLGET
ncbi:hypothetical protein FHG87_003887 [Trinorchestia longiramus]|nr:hypothetical protein FHG87_003887 [Trinorchestia longiramus]